MSKEKPIIINVRLHDTTEEPLQSQKRPDTPVEIAIGVIGAILLVLFLFFVCWKIGLFLLKICWICVSAVVGFFLWPFSLHVEWTGIPTFGLVAIFLALSFVLYCFKKVQKDTGDEVIGYIFIAYMLGWIPVVLSWFF